MEWDLGELGREQAIGLERRDDVMGLCGEHDVAEAAVAEVLDEGDRRRDELLREGELRTSVHLGVERPGVDPDPDGNPSLTRSVDDLVDMVP